MVIIERLDDAKVIPASTFFAPNISVIKGKFVSLQISEKNNDLIVNLQADLKIDPVFFEQIPMLIVKGLANIVPESIQVSIYILDDIKGHSVVFENAKTHPFYNILKEKIIKKLIEIF
jgi:hypothetical protein